MAWVVRRLRRCILLVSDLNLPADAPGSTTIGVRRPLVAAFAVGALSYLRGEPRSLAACMAGGRRRHHGLGALVTLALAGGTRAPGLFAVQLFVAALALGAVNAAMLLGHWYLVTPKLTPLRCVG